MVVRIVRLGSPRSPGEGTRIGTVRRPPRGVPKAECGHPASGYRCHPPSGCSAALGRPGAG